MKPHIIVKLKEGVEPVTAPYWADFIDNKSTAVENLNRNFDEVMRKRKMKFWVTSEFKPHTKDQHPQYKQWSKEEVESGLNRIYRIILQEDTDIPPQLIEDIKLVPVVEKASPGRVGVSKLPEEGLSLSLDTNLKKPAEQIFLYGLLPEECGALLFDNAPDPIEEEPRCRGDHDGGGEQGHDRDLHGIGERAHSLLLGSRP